MNLLNTQFFRLYIVASFLSYTIPLSPSPVRKVFVLLIFFEYDSILETFLR